MLQSWFTIQLVAGAALDLYMRISPVNKVGVSQHGLARDLKLDGENKNIPAFDRDPVIEQVPYSKAILKYL